MGSKDSSNECKEAFNGIKGGLSATKEAQSECKQGFIVFK